MTFNNTFFQLYLFENRCAVKYIQHFRPLLLLENKKLRVTVILLHVPVRFYSLHNIRVGLLRGPVMNSLLDQYRNTIFLVYIFFLKPLKLSPYYLVIH